MTDQPRDPYDAQPDYPQPQPQTQTWDTRTWGDRSWDERTWDERSVPQHDHSPSAETAHLPFQDRADAPAPAAGIGAGAPMPASESPTGPAAGPGAAAAPRLTAAQQARAEGRSPVIAPGLQPAALTAALAALIALAAPFGRPALAVPVVLLQAVTAAGWFRLNGMWPARQGIALAFAGGIAADVALLLSDRTNAPAAAIAALSVWCLLILVLQLRNHGSPDERLHALTATVASTALAVLAAGHLAAAAVSSDAVVVGAVAVAVAALARSLPMPPYVAPLVALVAAAGAGIAVGGMTDLGPSGALLGVAAGGCALIGLRVASYDYPSRFVHLTAGVALPLALAAPAVYVLGRVLS